MNKRSLPFLLLAPTLLVAVQTAAVFDTPRTPNVDSAGNIFTAIAPIATSDVWAVGFSGDSQGFNDSRTMTQHFDGRSWRVVSSPNPNPGACPNPSLALTAVGAASSSDVWSVGFRNSNFSCTSQFQPVTLHWNGSAWAYIANPELSDSGNNALNGVAALASNNVYAVGYQSGAFEANVTLVEHWDGSAWTVMPSPNANSTGNVLSAVSASSPSDIWAVGNQVAPNIPVFTLTEHFNGSAWSVVPSPNVFTAGDLSQNVLLAVSALAPNDATAAGYVLDSGQQRVLTLIEHWNGAAWSVVPSPNPSSASGSLNRLTGIAALSPTNIYAFGYFSNSSTGGQTRTLAEHFDGTSWSIVPSPVMGRAQQLYGAAALPSTHEIWAGGGYSIPGINFEFGFLQVPKSFLMHSANP